MKSPDALPNGSLSANHCGSVCPWGLTIGRSLTVAYSARENARCVGSEENNRSGWSSSLITGLPLVATMAKAARHVNAVLQCATRRRGLRLAEDCSRRVG